VLERSPGGGVAAAVGGDRTIDHSVEAEVVDLFVDPALALG